MKEKEFDSFGFAGLLLGIFGVLLSFIPFVGLTLSLLGIFFSAKQSQDSQTDVSLAGIIISTIGLVLSLVYSSYWGFLLSFLKIAF